MAVAFVEDTLASWGSAAGTKTFTKPSGTTTDDILVAVQFLNTDNAITVPSGWTHEINFENNTSTQEHRFHMYWLRCGGSEPSDYTTTWSGTFNTEIWCGCFSGCKTSGSPINVSNAIDGGTGGTPSSLSITTTVDGCMLIYNMCNWNGGAFTPPSSPGSFTEPSPDGDGIVIGSSYFLQTTQGSTGSVAGSCSLGGAKSVLLFALEPAAGAPAGQPTMRRWDYVPGLGRGLRLAG